jgi:hypothetical protein
MGPTWVASHGTTRGAPCRWVLGSFVDCTITASTDRAPNGNGSYDGDVTVTFACSDSLSGVRSCPAPIILGEGDGQSANGSVRDNAGNSASNGVTGIDVDTPS